MPAPDKEQYDDLILCVERIAEAITPFVNEVGRDASGGYVASLTEAVMGMTAGLHKIADSISDLADAVRDEKS